MSNKRKKILMLVLSTVNPDVRVEKEARYLASKNFDVSVIGITRPSLDLPKKEERDGYLIYRVEIKKKLFFKYFEFYRKVKKLVGSELYDYIHFHDLNALPAIFRLKKNGKIFVYDSHENFPEQMSETFGWPAQIVYTWVERYFIKKVNYVLTPGKTYSNLIEKKYKVKASVISNYPSIEDVDKGHDIEIPKEFQKKAKFRVVYFGVMYANLGYDVTVKVAKYLRDQYNLSPSDIDFLIIGDGAAYQPMKKMIEEEKLNEYFILTGWMNYHLALSVLRTSDVGLILFQPGKNNFRRIPNRLYEYYSAGVPFIGSDFEGLREGASYYKQLGFFVNPQSPEEISEKIVKLINDEETLEQLKKNTEEAYKNKFNWETEIKKIHEVYK
ncbi:MAG: glycosyltransferase family 4 protein [Candidatus Heimdallarchaeum endolithica]|uniref:Glycosyltransferase family 4 protein n=1 Tax=Candidatus Heimdallarchaeum endolithica TaxID=2876572 RepID=A0A9Y1BRY8_9ARCH|nr:MAG: glycosyltransferase family 4 protein [Candidatus Heimdallarchaeum endolithica]